jgi:anti-anti-sigma factor
MADEGRVAFERLDEHLLAKLSGDLSDVDCAALMDRITERLPEAPTGVIVDLTDVSRVGSIVLGKLVRLGQVCRDGGRRISIVAGEGKVLRVVELLGLTSTLERHATVAEAILAAGAERRQPEREGR